MYKNLKVFKKVISLCLLLESIQFLLINLNSFMHISDINSNQLNAHKHRASQTPIKTAVESQARRLVKFNEME